jgi:hypothetical protein
MAIKRPTKTAGTPVRKTSSSPGLKHVDVRPLQQMIAGETYTGWLCKNKACGRAIAIVPAQLEAASAADRSADDHSAAIKCPHCGDEDLYRWGTRGAHLYAVAS